MPGVLLESEFAGSLVFKGGTSLSKVFGVIERFLEDIDLSLSPAFSSTVLPPPDQYPDQEQIEGDGSLS